MSLTGTSTSSGPAGTNARDPATEAADQTVALAIERLALGSLRLMLVLTVLSAASDTVLAALDGVGAPLVLFGVAMSSLALTGVVWPRRAANVLAPRGRIVLVAVLFSLLGVLEPGLQSHFEEMPIAGLAAVVASPVWVAACVAILSAAVIVDMVAAGHSLAWVLTGPGQSTAINELLVLCAMAAIVLGAISVLRRTITSAPGSLAAVRDGGGSLTPQLALAASGSPVGLLARADPTALTQALSRAENRVLALLADGLAPKQAAHQLGVSLPTVRSQIASAKRKTGARTFEQLVGIYAEATYTDAACAEVNGDA